jgi:outer membrane murein-binding lipoprotein Lpp
MSKNALLEKKLKEMVLIAQHKMLELSIQVENLDSRYQQLLDDIDSTPEQVKAYAENPANYEQPIWELLHNEKEKLENGYNHDINSVRDVNKVKKTFSERKSIQSHWIHVR